MSAEEHTLADRMIRFFKNHWVFAPVIVVVAFLSAIGGAATGAGFIWGALQDVWHPSSASQSGDSVEKESGGFKAVPRPSSEPIALPARTTIQTGPPSPTPAEQTVTIARPELVIPKAIPVRKAGDDDAPTPKKRYSDASTPEKPQPAPGLHTVCPGDTLYSIANRYGVSVKSLQQANKLTRPETLRDGMIMVIPER